MNLARITLDSMRKEWTDNDGKKFVTNVSFSIKNARRGEILRENTVYAVGSSTPIASSSFSEVIRLNPRKVVCLPTDSDADGNDYDVYATLLHARRELSSLGYVRAWARASYTAPRYTEFTHRKINAVTLRDVVNLALDFPEFIEWKKDEETIGGWNDPAMDD